MHSSVRGRYREKGRGMNKKFKRTSAELICGILISGALIQIVDLLVAAAYPQFASMRLLFASGLWIGVAVAIILEVHMYRSIARALDMRPEDADGCGGRDPGGR